MTFTINANFLANARPVAHLCDGSKVVFSQRKFDAWSIYHVGNSVADAIKDVDVLHYYKSTQIAVNALFCTKTFCISLIR
jgi:hypothetical protein